MEPTSEQELKQLLDEGRITEEEYQELLEALRQKETAQKPVEKPKESKPRTGYGKAALILMIAGFLMPIAALVAHFVIMYAGVRLGMFLFLPFLLLGIFCEFLAFIFGIIGWKTASGKIAAIGVPCLGLLIVPGLLLLSLFGFRASHVPAYTEHAVTLVQPIRNLVSYKSYPLDTMDGVLTTDNVQIDNDIFAEGYGSLKVGGGVFGKRTIRLLETGPMSLDNCMLIYSAQLKSQLGAGNAHLEMRCDIPGRGEFFSRGLEQPITGITEWTNLQIPFRLEKGQSPSNVKLNLVVEGTGTVWIDDVKLLSSPLD